MDMVRHYDEGEDFDQRMVGRGCNYFIADYCAFDCGFYKCRSRVVGILQITKRRGAAGKGDGDHIYAAAVVVVPSGTPHLFMDNRFEIGRSGWRGRHGRRGG